MHDISHIWKISNFLTIGIIQRLNHFLNGIPQRIKLFFPPPTHTRRFQFRISLWNSILFVLRNLLFIFYFPFSILNNNSCFCSVEVNPPMFRLTVLTAKRRLSRRRCVKKKHSKRNWKKKVVLLLEQLFGFAPTIGQLFFLIPRTFLLLQG